MSTGNVSGSRQRKRRRCLSPDNISAALKGSIKIRQLWWPFGCWHCCLRCESCSWASASVDPDCLLFTRSLWGGGKVSFAPSRSRVVTGIQWFLFPPPAAQGSVKAPWCQPRLGDEAKLLKRGFPLTQSSSTVEVLGKISLKKFQCWKTSLRTTRLLGDGTVQWLRSWLCSLITWVQVQVQPLLVYVPHGAS